MGMDGGGGGGKLPYSHHDANNKLVNKSFTSRVEPRKFGVGVVAGFLLVTCAYYFSTAKFDAIHIATISSPSSDGNAAGIVGSSPRAAAANDDGSNSKQQLDSGGNASPEDTRKKDETSVRDGGGDTRAAVVASAAAVGGQDDEVPANDDDDDATGVLLPPVSSEEEEYANSTQESGVLEDEELKAQYAIANAAKKNDGSSSNGGSPSVVPSDPAIRPAPVKQIPPLPSSDVVAPAEQQVPPVPEIKQADSETTPPLREWKPLCDVTSNRRIDWCELDGDVRVVGTNATVTLVASSDNRTFREETWRVKPYPRKADPNAMRHVRVVTVRSVAAAGGEAPPSACTERYDDDVPALVFSDRGYVGNYFHAYTDVILPLFLTARRYGGEVRLLVTDFQAWWLGKFMPVFKSISNYEVVDLDRDPRVHCFRHVQVGLTSHSDFSIDPARAPNGYSMLDFTKFMRAVYHLPRDTVAGAAGGSNKRPRLLVIARARSRRFVNTDEIVRGARKAGFEEVVVSEGEHEVAPFAELANSCDAMLGVHGAGLTNMAFLPTGGAVIQVVPLGGLEFVAGYFRGPAADMGLRYLEYRIAPEESTLVEQYPRDHPVLADPDGVKSKGWDSLKEAYLDKQDVRLDMRRFRPTLKKAVAYLRKAKASNGDN